MNKLYILLLVLGLFLLYKISEGFVNFEKLQPFLTWGDHDNANVINYKPTKTSDLVSNCDEKRKQCIYY